ncbi:MAG: ribbon-helix-helix protein, CopG family [Candidatus Diapherotrites archaeon]|uniref:Ribbon-helix-helix protein, CopG family n=1 Tax=Candidatus Iainarchaeum sp. TaxID=3101447 RepID=A0A938YX41_9ARCH|nr:ribbon-helix-helix protein, CopG family [Candidatus Diapherotrites archaeon]
MRQYVMNVEPKLIAEVDRIIKKEKLYSSRNEFIRDAIRGKVLDYRRLLLRAELRKIAENALAKGWNGKMPSKKQRGKIAEEYLAERGLSLD